jgi:hypothetical protein
MRSWFMISFLRLNELLPNKALQLTGHSAFQSIHGIIWH